MRISFHAFPFIAHFLSESEKVNAEIYRLDSQDTRRNRKLSQNMQKNKALLLIYSCAL
jgi:hypothetical protein